MAVFLKKRGPNVWAFFANIWIKDEVKVNSFNLELQSSKAKSLEMSLYNELFCNVQSNKPILKMKLQSKLFEIPLNVLNRYLKQSFPNVKSLENCKVNVFKLENTI